MRSGGAASAQLKRLGMDDSNVLEVKGWKDVTLLRRYTAAVASELAARAHNLSSPATLCDMRPLPGLWQR